MKSLRLFTTAFALLFIGSFATAQTEVGIKIGGNFGNASVKGITDGLNMNFDNLNTFTGGIVVRQRIDKLLTIQSGIEYKQKGFILNEGFPINILNMEIPVGIKAETRVNYIEIPVLLEANFLQGCKVQPYVAAGPSFGYATSGTIDTKASFILDFNVRSFDLDLSRQGYNRLEVAGKGVTGIKVPYGRGIFDLGLSYTHAFTKFVDDIPVDLQIRNKGLGIHVGFNYVI